MGHLLDTKLLFLNLNKGISFIFCAFSCATMTTLLVCFSYIINAFSQRILKMATENMIGLLKEFP